MPTVTYSQEGYVVAAAVPPAIASDLAARFELEIVGMAQEIGVPIEGYLASVCRWSTPNPRIQALVDDVIGYLQPMVEKVLGASVRVQRASVFRKSGGALGTHAHQDAGYWVRPSSSRYDATSWVSFDNVDESSGALRILPRSHRPRRAAPVDYLAPAFVDPVDAWGPSATTLRMSAGDVVVFDPYLWHASHGSAQQRVRRALAVRWEIDGSSLVPSIVPPEAAIPERFGMFTSGEWLHRALRNLAGQDLPKGEDGVRWALENDLPSKLPDPRQARSALMRLQILWKARERHHASDERGMVWDAVRDFVVAPVSGPLGLDQPRPGA